jgi:hypothetical protein
MPSYIVQPVQGEDFYVVWSEVVDGPTFAGTADELHAHMRDRALQQFERDHARSLVRAQAVSCSAYIGATWDDDTEFVYEGTGWVKRSQLRALVESLDAQGAATDATLTLIRPFEDDD